MRCSTHVPRIQNWFARHRDRIAETLSQLVRIDTCAPHEERIFPIVTDEFRSAGFAVEPLPLHRAVADHPAYSGLPGSSLAPSRHTLRAVLEQTASQSDLPTTLLSAHLDVVPGTADVRDAGQRDAIVLNGRGACDNKNNVLMVAETFRCLRDCGITPTRHAVVDLVIEEEIGGTGALSSCLWGIPASDVIVLEPTDLRVFRGHRGCIGIEIVVGGTSAHMGCRTRGISAIDGACATIAALRAIERRMVEAARKDPGFACWDWPVQINVGAIHGGEWHGSVPEHCVLSVNVGFVPPHDVAQAFDALRRELGRQLEGSGIAPRITLNGLRNDGYLLDEQAPLVRQLLHALHIIDRPQQDVYAWNVSCDARLYAHLAQRPTVVFGCGALEHAHTASEHVRLDDIGAGIAALAHFFSTSPANQD